MKKVTHGLATIACCVLLVPATACASEPVTTTAGVAAPTTAKPTTTKAKSTTTTVARTTTTVVQSVWGTPLEVNGLRIKVDDPIVNEDFVVKWREDVWYDSVFLVPITVEGVGPDGGYLDVDRRFGLLSGGIDFSPAGQAAQPPVEYDAALFPEYAPMPSGMYSPGESWSGWLLFGRRSSDTTVLVEYLDGWFDDLSTPRGGSYQWQTYWKY